MSSPLPIASFIMALIGGKAQLCAVASPPPRAKSSSSRMREDLWPFVDALTDSTVYGIAMHLWLAEYNPEEYPRLLEPILNGKADVVFGSRFMGGRPHRVVYFWHMVGNKLLTFFSNMCTNVNLTDMETCYKAFRTAVLRNIDLREDRFGFEPEITAKVARARCRIYEVGISYDGRTYEEGKKITWRDGIRAFYAIIRYNFFTRKPAAVFSNETSASESADTVGLGPRLKHS